MSALDYSFIIYLFDDSKQTTTSRSILKTLDCMYHKRSHTILLLAILLTLTLKKTGFKYFVSYK